MVISYSILLQRPPKYIEFSHRSTNEREKKNKTPKQIPLQILFSMEHWKIQLLEGWANLCHSSGTVHIYNRKSGREVSSASAPSPEQRLQMDLIPTTPSASGKPPSFWHLYMIKFNCSKESQWNLRTELGLFNRFLNAILWDMNLPF